MACISYPNTCPAERDLETTLLGKILQVLNSGGGGGGSGVSGLSVNGGPFQTGNVSIATGNGVQSVNGDAGPIVNLDSSEVPEGASNFYYTAARFNTSFAGKTTTDLTEGLNLYYTAARFNTAFAGKTTTDLAEGLNLYYTAARFNTAFATKTTTDLAEGTGLYFTEPRVRATVLTGLVSQLGTITAADSVLVAFGKTQGRLAALEGGTGPFVLKAGDTMSGPLVITPSATDVTPLTLSGYSLTAANAQSAFSVTGTWNTSGNPTALFANILNTASGATSKLLDLQIGSVSQFHVTPVGRTVQLGGISASAAKFTVDTTTGTVSVAPSADSAGVQILQSATGASAPPGILINTTWNTSGAPTALLVPVTNTASSANSLLFDFLIAASSVFNLRVDGRLTLAGRTAFTTTSSIGHSLAASDALNTVPVVVLALQHTLSSGVGAAGIGVYLDMTADTTTTPLSRASRWATVWTTATHATRTSSTTFNTFTAGTETIDLVLANSQIQGNDGSIGTPAFTSRNDTNTGVYFPAADQLAITLGGTAYFSITSALATLGTELQLSNSAALGADPTNASTQWAVSGEWQYRSSAASEGAGQTNRVHNRAAEVVGAGTNYTFTTSSALLDFGTTDPEIVLPTAGTYLLLADIGLASSALSTNDAMFASFRNVTDSTNLGGQAVTLGVSFLGMLSFSAIVTVTATKTLQLWGGNATAARGEAVSTLTRLKYIRLY